MNILNIIFLAILLLLAVPSQAQAGTNCTGSYGGGYTGSQSCANLIVDKKVLKPGTSDYVDNLSLLDPKYHSNDTVVFQIVVQNTGNEPLNDLQAVDTLPDYVTYAAGAGNYDQATKKLSFNIPSLNAGTSQTFYVSAKVNADITFNNNGMVCPTNNVHVEKKDKASADDSAQFCIERALKVYKTVLGIQQTPPTGPEAAALPILFGMGGLGWLLRKKK